MPTNSLIHSKRGYKNVPAIVRVWVRLKVLGYIKETLNNQCSKMLVEVLTYR